ncbi:probable polyamine oxidase 5 [Olea europaea var. sylvestris]|uniref:probable polyamine oxidase 5 n=1 Tax=Olea europaea var. sylvestris TaxID=158386 RepID=UPI000C1CFB05|nr:probable polyamine oxidase 5 [Olea europaea var. sylvestris]
MVSKKPRIVIIGAGMAGLTAANKLYTASGSKELFELFVVEGGTRIGGRINTSEFCGDRIELGATWIHGIGGSPVYKIAQEIDSLKSDQPWECMDGNLEDPLTIAEGGYELNPSFVESISSLFKNLMDLAQGKVIKEDGEIVARLKQVAAKSAGDLSVGSFLEQGLEAYWSLTKDEKLAVNGFGNWSGKSLQEAIFAMHENTQRTYTSADNLHSLDYNAESEYKMFPGEEITIAKGYLSVIQSLVSVLPAGLIQLGRKVVKIEWLLETKKNGEINNGWPVKLHFSDGSTMYADHVILTVSLGVLKQGIKQDSGLFSPPLPSFKTGAISRLGYGVVDKLFLQLSNSDDDQEINGYKTKFPFLQMVFHQKDSNLRHPKIPWWIRRTASLSPIYSNSRVLLSWFAGKEALQLESLNDEEILNGVSTTVSNLLPHNLCNSAGVPQPKFDKVLRTKWGTDPLFLGSYSYVAVGSSGDDLDTLAEPLPKTVTICSDSSSSSSPLQILFAGEATHRTHYSTTHGAYFSGLREANRLLKHYNCIVV